MISIADIPTHLYEIAFNPDATAYELLQIVLSFSVFWFIIFSITGYILGKLTYGKPWLRAACERDYERGMKQMMEEYGFEMSKEEYIDEAMKDWPLVIVMNIQHTAGALLCVSSL